MDVGDRRRAIGSAKLAECISRTEDERRKSDGGRGGVCVCVCLVYARDVGRLSLCKLPNQLSAGAEMVLCNRQFSADACERRGGRRTPTALELAGHEVALVAVAVAERVLAKALLVAVHEASRVVHARSAALR